MNAPSDTIPPAAYAICAYEAAKLFGEDPADLFDPDCKSRARFTAIEVMRRAYPYEFQAVIARNIGMEGDARRIANLCQSARMSPWWREQYVQGVSIILSRTIRRPVTIADVARVLKVHEGPAESQYVAGAKFVPRKIATRLTAPPRRSRDVTAYLMGDPGARSARMDRGELSAGVE